MDYERGWGAAKWGKYVKKKLLTTGGRHIFMLAWGRDRIFGQDLMVINVLYSATHLTDSRFIQ